MSRSILHNFWKWLVLGSVACVAGCPNPMKEGIDLAKVAVEKIVDKADITNINMKAGSRVVNPAYVMKGFAGTGFYFDATMAVTGVDITADFDGNGSSNVDGDASFADKAERILNRPKASDKAIDALIEIAKQKVAAAQKPETASPNPSTSTAVLHVEASQPAPKE